MMSSHPISFWTKDFFLNHPDGFGKFGFYIVVLYGGLMLWFTPHLPIIDLPQHAAQVALFRDILEGQSKWPELFYINYFTPYLVGYGLVFLLSYLMPIAAAFKVLLALGFYGFVYACVLLRKQFGSDNRLDWLFIPSYFGFAYIFGFFTFLLAAPLGLLFIALAYRYAHQPNVGLGMALAFASFGLFFSHGLIFIFANAIGVVFIALKHRQFRKIIGMLYPYIIAATLFVCYILIRIKFEVDVIGDAANKIYWGFNKGRLTFPFMSFTRYVQDDKIMLPIGIGFFIAPLLLKSHLNSKNLYAFVPLALLVVIWFVIPSIALTSSSLYQRFAIFLLPCYGFIFCNPQHMGATAIAGSNSLRTLFANSLLPLLCCVFLGIQTERLIKFAHESAAFDELLAITEPHQRALSLVFEKDSPAAASLDAYLQYPLWYQAEKHGLVDFNFAIFLPQVVRFKPSAMPAVLPGFEWHPEEFNWVKHQGYLYRYFFVRNSKPLPVSFFDNQQCKVNLVKSAGSWQLYESTDCVSGQ